MITEPNTRKKVRLNIFFSIIAQVITVIVGVLIPRFFIISFGSEVNGFVNSLNQVFTYVALLEAGVGVASLQALYKPVAENDRGKINGILSSTNYFYRRTGLIYIGIIIVLAFVYPIIVRASLSYWLMVMLVIIIGLSGVVPYFFQAKYRILLQAEGKVYISSLLSTIQTVLLSVSRLLLLLLGFNVIIVQSVYLIVNLLVGCVYLIYVRKKYPWISLKSSPDSFAISKKKYVMVHQISSLIFNNTDVLLLTFLCDLKTVSIYALFKAFINIVSNVFSILLDSTNFKLAQSFQKQEKYKTLFKTFEVYYLALVFCLCTITYFFLEPFMRIYTANMDVNYIVPLFSSLMVFSEVLNFSRMPYLNAINYAGHFKETMWNAIFELIINISVSIVMVKLLGLNGVIIGTIVALLFRTFDVTFYCNKHLLQTSSSDSLKAFLINGLLSFTVILIWNRLEIKLDNYLIIFLLAGITTIILIPVYFCVNSLLFKKRYFDFKKILKKR